MTMTFRGAAGVLVLVAGLSVTAEGQTRTAAEISTLRAAAGVPYGTWERRFDAGVSASQGWAPSRARLDTTDSGIAPGTVVSPRETP